MNSHPLLLRLPGLRRYGTELVRLRRHLDAAESKLRTLKEQHAQLRDRERQLSSSARQRDRELADLRAQLACGSTQPDTEHGELLRKALRFDYYWYNAEKKIDLRTVDGFGPLAERVRQRGRTLLHLDRLYTLWQAVGALPEGAAAAAEVGAFKGGSAWFMAEAMRMRGRELPFYVCDTFRGHVEVDDRVDGWHEVATQFASVDVERVEKYLSAFTAVKVIQGNFRDTSAQLYGQDRFGLVHIDVDVYPITRYCLEFFGPRLVAGGTIVVDDYGLTTCAGAKKAVDEYVSANPRFRMLHLLTGQAVLIPVHAA